MLQIADSYVSLPVWSFLAITILTLTNCLNMVFYNSLILFSMLKITIFFLIGIPFLTVPDEQVLQNELLNRYKQNCLQAQTPSKVSECIPIPDNHIAEIETAW